MIRPTKICENSECQDIIENYKSAKKKYCNDQCRQRAWYLNELKKYHLHFEYLKEVRAIIKMFEGFLKRGVTELALVTLNDLNINLNSLRYPEHDSAGRVFFTLNDLIITLHEDKNKVTIKKQKL